MIRVECRHEAWQVDGGLDLLFVAYGTVARICKTAIEALRSAGALP